jgi:membrane associated rhomboid family serine protease
MSYREQPKRYGTAGIANSPLLMLIAISLILFVSLAFIKTVWFSSNEKETALALFYRDVMSLFALPADKGSFAQRPWTILTHMFADDKFIRVFANMFWLWSFGFVLQDLAGSKKVIPVFVYGALGGAVIFLLSYNIFPSLQSYSQYATLYGASCGIMAVAAATTILSPGYRLFPMIGGGIPLWVLTALYVGSDVAAVGIRDTGTLLAHAGGAGVGVMFAMLLQNGTDMGKGMNDFFDWVTNLFNPDKPSKQTSIKDELFYKAETEPYKKTMNLTQKRVDDVLDKINQQGYNSLTQEEKDLLKRAAEKENL